MLLDGLSASNSLIIAGPRGVGKFTRCQKLAEQASATLFVVEFYELVDVDAGRAAILLRNAARRALAAAPALLCIRHADDVLRVAAGFSEAREADAGVAGRSAASNSLSACFVDLVNLLRGQPGVGLIFTACNVVSIRAALRQSLDSHGVSELVLPVPSRHERALLVASMIGRSVSDDLVVQLAEATTGLVAGDLARLVMYANRELDAGAQLAWPHFRAALHHAGPPRRQESRSKSALSFGDAGSVAFVDWAALVSVGGARENLAELLELSLADAAQLSRLGLAPLSGVLVTGPPGSGKTHLLAAAAHRYRYRLSVVWVRATELFSKYLGDSEHAVRQLFRSARLSAPALICLDDVDAVGGRRANDDDSGGGVQSRVLTQLLAEMDGVAARGDVVVLAACRCPQLLDAALLRPGRFDSVLRLPAVPTRAEYAQLLAQCTHSLPVEANLSVDSIVDQFQAQALSCAAVAEVCRRAALAAMDEAVANRAEPVVRSAHFFARDRQPA